MKANTKTILACMYLGICLIALTGEYTGESEAGFFAYYVFFLLNMFNAARLLNKLDRERNGDKEQPEEAQSAERTEREGAL
jgi:hypothetical protein